MFADLLRKTKKEFKKLKETEDSRYIYQNELDKAWFQHDLTYGDFEDLNKRTTADKVLRDKAFSIAKNPKHDGCRHGLAFMVYKFFNKITSGGKVKTENISNKELAEELHKTIVKKIKKRKVQSTFKDNVWGADVADIQLIIKFKKGLIFYYALLTFILIMHELFL